MKKFFVICIAAIILAMTCSSCGMTKEEARGWGALGGALTGAIIGDQLGN